MKIAVDVGYGDVKAVNEHLRKVRFTSVFAPAKDPIIGKKSKDTAIELSNALNANSCFVNGTDNNQDSGCTVEIKYLNERGQETKSSKSFIGDLAVIESKNASFSMDSQRYIHPIHDTLLLTAAALLSTEREPIELGVGLPIDFYNDQADALASHLSGLRALVKVDDASVAKLVCFKKVTVYLQDLSVLLCLMNRNRNGLVACVDPGYNTSDVTVFEMNDGKPRLINDLTGSCEIGVSQIDEAVLGKVKKETGAILEQRWVKRLIREEKIVYDGTDVNLSGTIKEAIEDTTRAIMDRITEKWRERGKFIAKTYCIGGIEMFPDMPKLLPRAEIVPNPRFANAFAYMELMGCRTPLTSAIPEQGEQVRSA